MDRLEHLDISYRRLGSADSRQYRAIRLESLKRHPESFGSGYQEQSRLPKLMFEKALEQSYDDRFVAGAFDQEELIGICGFVPFVMEDFPALENSGTILQMYVRSTYRGRKVGLNLVKTVLEEAFQLPGIQYIVLGVRADNQPAIRIYEQAGFLRFHPKNTGDGGPETGFVQMIIRKNMG